MRSMWVASLVGLCCAAALAQAAASDLERARRDAEKVFSFIKFHSVKRAAPARPPAAPTQEEPKAPARRSLPERGAGAAQQAGSLAPISNQDTALVPVQAEVPVPESKPATPVAAVIPPSALSASAPQSTAGASANPASAPIPVQASAEVEVEAEVDARAVGDDEELAAVALRLREFVAPELSPSLLASLGPSMPRVRLRFSVEADGRVSSAAAREGTPRRLAVVAERALLQWRFEALPAAQDAEVELVFQRD